MVRAAGTGLGTLPSLWYPNVAALSGCQVESAATFECDRWAPSRLRLSLLPEAKEQLYESCAPGGEREPVCQYQGGATSCAAGVTNSLHFATVLMHVVCLGCSLLDVSSTF